MGTALSGPARPLKYRLLVGTGGIGSGLVFDLAGDHTLGREESRAARLRPAQDFCKLHIISHYPALLLGPDLAVLPVGAVGADDPGRATKTRMASAGMDVSHVAELPDAGTLFSVCFLYPDGTGGNLTTTDSASARVTPAMIAAVRPRCEAFRGAGLALAAPEVPLDTRAALLDLGTELGFFRAASVVKGEARAALEAGLFHKTDLLSVNQEEARALADAPADRPLPDVLATLTDLLLPGQPRLRIVVTAGAGGAHGFADGAWTHVPAVPATVASTAGAGDAFLAGLLIGECRALPFVESLRFASLLASLKVSSADTIHLGINEALLRAHGRTVGVTLPFP